MDKELTINGLTLLAIAPTLRKLTQVANNMSSDNYWNLVDFAMVIYEEEDRLLKARSILVKTYSPKDEKGEPKIINNTYQVDPKNIEKFQFDWREYMEKDIKLKVGKLRLPKSEIPIGPEGMLPAEVIRLKLSVIDVIDKLEEVKK